MGIMGEAMPREHCRGHSPYLFCGGIGCPVPNPLASRIVATIAAGDLAYLDTFSGLIPCKLVSAIGDEITVRLTATRKAYKRGEIVTMPPASVVPRKCVHVRAGQFRINPNYVITRDDEQKEV